MLSTSIQREAATQLPTRPHGKVSSIKYKYILTILLYSFYYKTTNIYHIYTWKKKRVYSPYRVMRFEDSLRNYQSPNKIKFLKRQYSNHSPNVSQFRDHITPND